MHYVDVILPLPLGGSYTYLLPPELEGHVEVGSRVIVPFGQKKIHTAIVIRLHDEAPSGYQVKAVLESLEDHPILLSGQLRLWRWMAEYYLCTLGDIYRAALPSGLKLESETWVVLNPDFESDVPLSSREQRVYDLLSLKSEQSVMQLQKASSWKSILPVIKSLLDKRAIFLKEEVRRNYKPRMEMRVRLAQEAEILSGPECEEHLQKVLESLKRAQKQQQLLLSYLDLSGIAERIDGKEFTPDPVSRTRLLECEGMSSALLKALENKGILEVYPFEIGRLNRDTEHLSALQPLSSAQQQAYNRILNGFARKEICLLHGVTSSGKTEIYMHLMQQALNAGKQVLFLLPEIALTTQITVRISRVFGARVGVYHSKYPDSTRVEIWQKQLSDTPYDIILGVRSSVFLPFQRLGLVIVDEEHEASYKQQDPAPRYHARNTALMLAAQCGAKTLLGSATPSLESYHNAVTGKYAYVPLTERFRGIELPEIQLVDITEQRRKKYMNGPFSAVLLGYIREALERKEQVILFQNRRGFAPMVECKECGWVPRCKNCDVSLTYHRGMGVLTCHYCGYTCQLPHSCPACESGQIISRGYGTERIEDALQVIFPEARMARMDLDTTRTRNAYEHIIEEFQEGRTDILIGTQMVTKGLDFDRVSVVGILDADMMLNYPDFRAYERAFQMMAQVAGRAGRSGHRGLVVLQTRDVKCSIIRQVVDHDYESMYDMQIAERESFRYPPFYRMIHLFVKHRQEEVAETMAFHIAGLLRKLFGDRVLGPDKPVVPRVQTFFIRKIMLKVETGASLQKVREGLLQVQQAALRQDRSLIIYADMDPQ